MTAIFAVQFVFLHLNAQTGVVRTEEGQSKGFQQQYDARWNQSLFWWPESPFAALFQVVGQWGSYMLLVGNCDRGGVFHQVPEVLTEVQRSLK